MSATAARVRDRLRGTPRARVASDAAGTFLLGLLLLGLGVTGVFTPVGPAPRWAQGLLLLTGCVIMLAKRRHPVAALAGGLVVFAVDLWLGGSIGVLVVLMDLIYSAALFAGPRAVRGLWNTTVALLLVLTAGVLVLSGSPRDAVLVGLYAFALLGTPMWWGSAVRRQAEVAALATARAEDAERLAALQQRQVLQEERARMARDLHDAVAGNLSAIAIHAEAALSLPDRPASPERTALRAVRDNGVQALGEMRSMIELLRGGTAHERAMPAGLAELPDLMAARRTDLDITVDVPEDLPDVPVPVGQAVYRIAQEALTNAAKHGPGGPVDVRLTTPPGAVELMVANRPVGPAAHPPPGNSMGLLTMRERAEALGGSFRAGWADDDGARRWELVARLPRESTKGTP